MIEQNKAKWANNSRTRRWHACIMGIGCPVVVRAEAIDLGEDESEYPPTHELTWDEWLQDCTKVYGMTAGGELIASAKDRADAMEVLARMADDSRVYDEDVRQLASAIIRLSKWSTP